MSLKSLRPWIMGLAVAALAACGGGGGDPTATGSVGGTTTGGGAAGATPMGTLRISLTDSPACGYDNAWVTVERVRVHRDSSAGDGDAGWIDLPLPQSSPTPVPAPQPLRVDLLTLTNGVLVPLGEVQLPAGTYSQLRLVLAANTASNPQANAVKPTGGSIVPLTTPSAQQSGLKMNVNLTVPAGQEADFAIDFDACKSFVKAGNSGKILLKPVLSVLPILYPAGQRIQGWLDPSLATAGAMVSVQAHGEVVRATPPVLDSGGNLRFELYPVPVGTYDLVVTANGHSTAIVTGVPSYAGSSTTVNSVAFPILPPVSNQQTVSGAITFDGGAVDTGGVVRALQLLTGGPTIEVASANAGHDDGLYEMSLPVGAPVKAPYVTGTAPLLFSPDSDVAGHYRLAATVTGSTEVKFADVVLGATPLQQNFDFVSPPTGQLIQGWLDPSLAASSATSVSVQMNGTIVQTTPPLTDGSGKFVLYPVPVGTYDVVVTTADRVTAVITGVPSTAGTDTTINTQDFPINPLASPRIAVFGQVTINGSGLNTGGIVRALQTLGSGPTVQVASDNARAADGLYGMLLATDAANVAPYVAGAAKLDFVATAGEPGHYQLSASVPASATVMTADIVVAKDPVVQDFHFTVP
jgi:Domain of unknown function (DUF4382)